MKRILHPTDFSPASRPAFAEALEIAKAEGAELLLVHVLAPVVPVAGDGYLPPKVYDDMVNAVRGDAQKRLDALRARAARRGVRARTLLLEGSAHDQIRRAARSHAARMIVMGTHGRGGVARLFLGSVAERVIGVAPCPVLTVRGR